MALALVDQVVDSRLIVDDALWLDFDLRFEVALRLKVVADVASTFVQQVVIDCMFFVDWDQSSELARR